MDSRLQQDVQSDDEEFYVELMSAGSGSEDEQSDDSEAEVAEVRPPPRQRHEHGNSRAGREATSLAAGIGPALAAGKRKRGLQREAQPAAAAEAEDVQEDCPARKRRGSAKRPSSSKKKQPAAPKAGERAAEATSPVAEAQPSERQAKQQRSKSRTPAAAAPALEVSASPASAAKAAATRPHPRQSQSPVAAQHPADQQQQEQQPGGKGCGASGASDPAGAARNLLVRRLKAPSSREAATMQLRPRLQASWGQADWADSPRLPPTCRGGGLRACRVSAGCLADRCARQAPGILGSGGWSQHAARLSLPALPILPQLAAPHPRPQLTHLKVLGASSESLCPAALAHCRRRTTRCWTR